MSDMPARRSGKLGRLAQRKVGDRFAIRYAHEYLTVPIPVPVYPIDVSRGITSWGMLGNDQAGDCGEAGQLHYQMATGADPASFDTAGALAEYYAFTGGQDTGVVLADFLLWLYNKGEILGFAPVDLSNQFQHDALMQVFHGLYVGVSLTPEAMQQFDQGQPWDGTSPDRQLGHCILQVGTAGVVGGYDVYVTWGADQKATQDWSKACKDEAWVIVTTWDQVDLLPGLQADINALGGTGKSPVPAPPPPAPDPPPQPPPTPWFGGCAVGMLVMLFLPLAVKLLA
jgi:hypothetical protein